MGNDEDIENRAKEFIKQNKSHVIQKFANNASHIPVARPISLSLWLAHQEQGKPKSQEV